MRFKEEVFLELTSLSSGNKKKKKKLSWSLVYGF